MALAALTGITSAFGTKQTGTKVGVTSTVLISGQRYYNIVTFGSTGRCTTSLKTCSFFYSPGGTPPAQIATNSSFVTDAVSGTYHKS